MTRTYRDLALVVAESSRQEFDKWYTLFTRDHGKIKVLGRGLRRTKSKMSPHLSKYSLVDVLVAEGRVVTHLAGASLVEHFFDISTSLSKRTVVDLVLLLLDKTTKLELADQNLFITINNFLASLEKFEDINPTLWFNIIVIKMFELCGLGLELNHCVGCRGVVSPTEVTLNILRGGVECARCRSGAAMVVSSNVIKGLRFYRDMDFETAAILQIDAQTAQDINQIVELILATNLDRPFESLNYLYAMYGNA